MPTYEYACTSCGYEWEFEQSIKDAPLTTCASCRSETARRQISRGTGFILKGGGWYSDLYSSSSNKPPSNPEKSDGAPAASSGESKSSDSGTSKTPNTSSKTTTTSKSETSASTSAPA